MAVNPQADAHEIIPRLWIGNQKSSQDETFIRVNHIDTVFNCTKTLPYHMDIPNKYRVPVDDNLQEEEIRNLELWAPEIAFKMIKEYNSGNRILVHCHAGMQRSAASVAIFLIAYKKLKAEEAVAFIKSRRPVAFMGGANFGRAIKSFELKFHNEFLPVIDGHTPSIRANSQLTAVNYPVLIHQKAKLD